VGYIQNLLIESGNSQSNLKGSVYELMKSVETEIVDVTEMEFYHPDLFFNINTPEDYSYAKQMLEGDRE
jgi:molybdopterin-guanine dinucleotide biosynthesis protein A